MNFKSVYWLVFLFYTAMYAQLDTVTYQWPVTPLNTSHPLNATFCEFRNTLTSDHFHNAVDIGKADGEPCYPVIDGQVYDIVSSASNSYVRVATNINGKWKHFTYLHIEPNPGLSLGENVTKGVTVLGTIYPGQGHVHLIERELVSQKDSYAIEINNIRSGAGLTPFDDLYPPVIQQSSLKFFIDGTKIQVPSYGLSGHIDIQIRIDEHNGTSASQVNNGTYLAGYRVWDETVSRVVYEPDDAGVKYRFDTKPENDYAHTVFAADVATLSDPVYWLTNGNGAAKINQTYTVPNGYFDAALLDTGDYVLEIFTEDTRGNTDDAFFDIHITDQDLTPPSTPEIYYLLNPDGMRSLEVSWKPNTEDDLLGYRLYYVDGSSGVWKLAADEFQLPAGNSGFSISAPDSFVIVPEQDAYFFRLTAVDSSGNESSPGDLYGRSLHDNSEGKPTALIVNGFTRYGGSGSWPSATHSFVKAYFDPLNNIDSLVISSCSNDAVINNMITLENYDIVIWFLGDESTADHTFTTTEQARVKSYLENGGKFFVSGSEIGWELGRSSSSADQAFYHNYLKASYVYDGNSSMAPAKGAADIFGNVQLDFGDVYDEDYPDDIDPLNGSHVIMTYNATRSASVYRKAGVAYSGSFGASMNTGQLVYLAFPFETVRSMSQRQDFMTALLSYFSVITGLESPLAARPQKISISATYPNPFNSSTRFRINLPDRNRVIVRIFDMLGREVDEITNNIYSAGEYTFNWDARNMASGLYMLKVQAGNFNASKKIILIK